MAGKWDRGLEICSLQKMKDWKDFWYEAQYSPDTHAALERGLNLTMPMQDSNVQQEMYLPFTLLIAVVSVSTFKLLLFTTLLYLKFAGMVMSSAITVRESLSLIAQDTTPWARMVVDVFFGMSDFKRRWAVDKHCCTFTVSRISDPHPDESRRQYEWDKRV